MLRKLMKYEFKSFSRYLIPLLSITVVSTLISSLLILMDSGNIAGFTFLIIISSVLISCASMFILYFLIFQRFYSSFFQDEGYLTFTLPVKTTTLINAKLFSAIIWIFIGSMTLTGCLMLYITVFQIKIEVSIVNMLKDMFLYIKDFFGEEHILSTFILTIIDSILSIFLNVLSIYFALTLGSLLAKKNKLVVSIVIYFGMQFVKSIFTNLIEANMLQSENAIRVINNYMFLNIGLAAVLSVFYYCMINNFLKNRLNLD